jgi:hypothetical protein
MSNVDISEKEPEYDPDVNPMERFKFTDEELVDYLKKNIVGGKKKTSPMYDHRKDADKAIAKVIKVLFFAWKDGGKTHIINTIPELDVRFGNKEEKSGVKYDPELNHLKVLLKRGDLLPGGPLEIADSEGKGDVIIPKFINYPTRYRKIFYPDGPMPTMQDPVAFVKELILFYKAVTWAHNNPELYRQMTIDEDDPKGLAPPNAAAFENYSILTNEIMNYVRTVSHDDKSEKLIAKGQELGAPIIKKFDNWDIRNCNWEYISGYIQNELSTHLGATARAKKKWVDSKPTDEDDIALYSNATFAFNAVVFLWHEKDPETSEITFYGQISSSDWMDPGMSYPIMVNPTFVKVVAELTKKSHANILKKHGKWIEIKKDDEYIKVWKENKKLKENGEK